jgi:L-alanine-DL-glutamate epimerase-like enolase superfamily enzyme
VIVKITADDGTSGWGQSVPVATWTCEPLEASLLVMRDYLAPALLGADPLDIVAAHAALDRALAPAFSTATPLARAGLDMAIHDLAGRLQGKSLAELLGRPRGGPVTLSWTLNPRTLDEAETLIEAGRQRGYRNFNIKVAPDIAFDVALARLVRRRAPGSFLWADANGGYDPAAALDAAPQLAAAGVDVLESPLRPNQIRGYQDLKRQAALPILMDEGIVSPVELAEFIRLGMLDGISMKPSRCGGLWPARQQIEMILDAGLMWLGSGLSDPDIALAASLGLYSAYGLARPAALNGPQFLTADVLAAPLAIADGAAAVPDGPGLGVVVDEQRLRAMAAGTRLQPLASHCVVR